jgi:hypothetical protein
MQQLQAGIQIQQQSKLMLKYATTSSAAGSLHSSAGSSNALAL